MKKTKFLLLPIIILMTIISFLLIDNNKYSKLEFNLNLELSLNESKLTNSIKSFSNGQYSIEQIDKKNLSLEEENKIIETALNITNAYNDINNKDYIKNVEKYIGWGSEKEGKLPDVVIACVGGGSNAIGTFYNFIEDEDLI